VSQRWADTRRTSQTGCHEIGTMKQGDSWMKFLFLAGRMILGGFFIYNGINHFKQRQALSQYAGAKHVPMPEYAVPASGILLLFGGASIVLGLKPKTGALAIIAFLAAVSPTMHDFWNHEDQNQRMGEMINFTKNMALLGSALALLGVDEPWPASVPVDEPSTLEKVAGFVQKKMAA
jgi:putative oxidoreductase